MSKTRILPLNFGPSGAGYECEIQRSRRKTLAIHVTHRKVQVRSPMRASKREIGEFMAFNQDCIEQRLYEEAVRAREALRIERGGRIFYRARELTIEFKEGRKQRVMIIGNRFIIQGHKLNPARARAQVEDFLNEKASNYIIPRARGLARHLGVEHKIREIKLRKTKSKWGHCTDKGQIQYNWLIMLAPYCIIDYMITHEVCHLVHMDHSRRFWNLVDSLCPNSEEYMNWLKEHEHRFWF
ncbi:MAG: SprT family zinc-dependent metalloprotease [Gammaproteobacteria bacterium]